jgi:uncharacterized protein
VITLLFKPTEGCNSSCVYCDGGIKKLRNEKMPEELLASVFSRISEYLAENPEEEIQFTWHGGEALIMGVDFFSRARDLQQSLCSGVSERIKHCIQSNLTLINQEFIDVFRELGITSVGTSYDPVPHMRGTGVNTDCREYNRLFMKGIELLEKNGITWGLIYVVTKRSLEAPQRIFNYLTNLELGGGVNFNAVLVYGEDTHKVAITPEEYADFLGAIFPGWWKRRDRYPGVSPFASMVKNAMGEGLSLGCNDSGACAFCHVYIGPGGETSHCGRSADWDIIWYGNIRDRTLADILGDKKRNVLQVRDRILSGGECNGCNLWYICHGGCPLDAHAEYGSFGHKSPWCGWKKIFIEKYFEHVTGLTVGRDQIL